MASAAKRSRVTPDEYLAAERLAPYKSEYRDGQVHAMSGARRPHNLIAANLARHIGNQIADRPCELYIAEMRVLIEPTGSFVYPDLVVVCGEPRLLDEQFDTLLNPTLIIEVLSPSTETWDRGGKFDAYRRLDSLAEYVLIDQARVRVQRFSRAPGPWPMAEWVDLGDSLRLESLGCEVALREIYARVPMPG